MQSFEIAHYGPSILFVGGEIDMAAAPELEQALKPSSAVGGPVVVDLTAVSFLDSTGINALVTAAQRLPTGCLILHGVHGRVAKVLELVRLSDLANVHVASCMIDPYPDGSSRSDGASSIELAAQLGALRRRFQRLHAVTESSRARTAEVLRIVRTRRAAQEGTRVAA